MDNQILFQLGDGAFWLSIIVGSGGLAIVAGVMIFAMWFKSQDPKLFNSGNLSQTSRQLIMFYLENRVEFWIACGQVVLAIVLVITLTILLLTRTISAEAGLSILSAIAGFVIAKGTSASRSNAVQTWKGDDTDQGRLLEKPNHQPNPPAIRLPEQSVEAKVSSNEKTEKLTNSDSDSPLADTGSPDEQKSDSQGNFGSALPQAEPGGQVAVKKDRTIVGGSVLRNR